MNHDITLPPLGRGAIFLSLDRRIPAQKSLLSTFENTPPSQREIVLTLDQLRVLDDALVATIMSGGGSSRRLVDLCRDLHAIIAPLLPKEHL